MGSFSKGFAQGFEMYDDVLDQKRKKEQQDKDNEYRDKTLGMQEERLGMERDRFGLEQDRLGLEKTKDEREGKRFGLQEDEYNRKKTKEESDQKRLDLARTIHPYAAASADRNDPRILVEGLNKHAAEAAGGRFDATPRDDGKYDLTFSPAAGGDPFRYEGLDGKGAVHLLDNWMPMTDSLFTAAQGTRIKSDETIRLHQSTSDIDTEAYRKQKGIDKDFAPEKPYSGEIYSDDSGPFTYTAGSDGKPAMERLGGPVLGKVTKFGAADPVTKGRMTDAESSKALDSYLDDLSVSGAGVDGSPIYDEEKRTSLKMLSGVVPRGEADHRSYGVTLNSIYSGARQYAEQAVANGKKTGQKVDPGAAYNAYVRAAIGKMNVGRSPLAVESTGGSSPEENQPRLGGASPVPAGNAPAAENPGGPAPDYKARAAQRHEEYLLEREQEAKRKAAGKRVERFSDASPQAIRSRYIELFGREPEVDGVSEKEAKRKVLFHEAKL